MGLFTRSNSSTTAAAPPAVPIAQPGTDATNLIAPVPAALQSAPPLVQEQAAAQRPALSPEQVQRFDQLKVRIHQQLVERLDIQNLKALPQETVRGEVRGLVRDLCQNE